MSTEQLKRDHSHSDAPTCDRRQLAASARNTILLRLPPEGSHKLCIRIAERVQMLREIGPSTFMPVGCGKLRVFAMRTAHGFYQDFLLACRMNCT